MSRRERKVVTVLFADLVGFTSRSETLDPEDVEAILRPYHERLRAEIERHGGTVEKFIGDAVMALFGAPVAHEDDPERAVRAALAIREAALEQGFDVRVAVNTGEALVSLDADPRAGETMAAGDVVNTAARLQAAAPVNGILVGEAAQRATREVIDYRPAEPVEAKGKAAPVPAWVAVEARSPFGVDVRQHGSAALVGRTRELDLLLGTFERACAERSPELVTLVGVPGIGKSRLLWELFQSLDRREGVVRWRQGRALPYGSLSFWAVAEMVKAHAGILEDDARDATAAKLGAAVAEAVPASERDWVEAHLRTLVGLEAEQSRDRAEAFTAWRRFFEEIAERDPLVLVFEDLHWADEGLLDFVDHLVDWAAGVPIFVLCSARPELLERRPGWGGGKVNAHTLALSPLGEAETATLVAAALERAVLPAETQAALLERAGGNPLYAEQFARLYRETGRVDELPETIQGIVAARLDALAREEKELLQNAAVLGKVFWLGAVEAMGCERAAVLVHGLARKEFVRRERSAAVGGEVELAFRHVLVRDVAYAQIPRADRSAKHVTAGIWIEALGRPEDHAELIAHHYVTALELARAAGTQSPELVDRARHALRDAGDRAHALGAYEAAAGHYGRALELWPANERDRVLLLFGRARARTWAGDADERELREAAAALLGIGRAELAAEVESLLSQVAWYADDGARSKEHLGRALELAEPLPESASKAWILAEASRLAALATDYDDSLEYGRRALELAEALELPHVRVHTLTSVGNVRAYLGDQDGIRLVEEGVRMARELNSPLLPRCLNNLSVAYGLYGRTREGLEAMQAAIAAGARFGLGPMLRFSRANLIGELYSEGRWDEALHEAQVLLDEAQATGLQAIERMVLGRRALIRLWRGNAAGADADTARALELARKAEEPQAVLPALLGRTIFLSASGRFDEARPLAQELLVRGGDTRLPYPGGADFWYVTQCVDSEEALASLTGRSTWRTPWLDAIEELLRGDPDRAVHQYRKLGARTDEAFARLRAGEVHLAAGRRTEAETHLEHAVEFYRRVRATLYVQQAEALLAEPALGRRPA